MVFDKLQQIEGVRVFGPKGERGPAVSFEISGLHPHDISTSLDQKGIAIRSGHHCAQLVMRKLQVPATAEIILEGVIHPGEMADEGPYGDHTGYYNEVDSFPVFTVERITHRVKPIYHSTYTGRPPDEPAILGVALNEVFVPILQKQFPEITDFYLPPEGCSYRMAIVTM